MLSGSNVLTVSLAGTRAHIKSSSKLQKRTRYFQSPKRVVSTISTATMASTSTSKAVELATMTLLIFSHVSLGVVDILDMEEVSVEVRTWRYGFTSL